jgi:hypothetical protein
MEKIVDPDELMIQIKEKIAEFGWFALGVFDPENRVPGYNYTLGLTESKNHPELIIFGLPHRSAHQIMADLIDLIGTKPLPLNTKIEQIANMPLVLRKVTRDNAIEYVGGDCALYGEYGFDLVQIVWPDERGNFPWEEGFDEKFIRTQPFLWDEDEDKED